jgi:molybdate transport system regulatory protein
VSETIELRGLIWMTAGNANLGGPGRIALLRAVRDTGSITGAAKARGMSYKGAWDAIDLMNRLSGEPLVLRATGGRGGGSTRLTERGAALIERYEQIERLHRAFVEAMSAASQGLTADLEVSLRPGTDGSLPTARPVSPPHEAPENAGAAALPPNRLSGVVRRVEQRPCGDEIELHLPGNHRLVATLAPGETTRLGLQEGRPAQAMLEASAVMLAAGPQADRVSARNRLPAVVAGVHAEERQTAVVLTLAGGVQLTALVATESLARLGLAPGFEVVAAFEASQLILAADDSMECRAPGDSSAATCSDCS